jgi:putative addiction module component (TIGR02574 family)
MSKEEILAFKEENPSPAEKALLDRELEEYRKNPEVGSTWDEVDARLRKTPRPVIWQSHPA